MSNHRHKRILIRGLLVKEMNFICPDAPSGCQNPWEFPKGIRANAMRANNFYLQMKQTELTLNLP